jgi:hypothetical protein
MIKTAENYAVNYCNRAFMQRTYRLSLDKIPCDDTIELPMTPLSTPATANVTFTYTDSTGGSATMPATCYDIDTNLIPNRIYLAYESEWPSDIRDHKDAITIDYNAGVTSATSIEEDVKSWHKMRVASMYENREGLMVGSGNYVNELPRSYVDGLLDEYLVIQVA